MSFKERFDSSETIIPPECIFGPPWCGKCPPEYCLYLMSYAFMSHNMTNADKERV